MKLYETEGDMCANAGGLELEGSIDPNTLHKWVWPFMDALAELEYTVVSSIIE